MPPMLPYEPIAELARLYDLLRDEGLTRKQAIGPVARKLGISYLTTGSAVTAAVALGLTPRWTLRAHNARILPRALAASREYLAERTASLTEDVALLWPRYYQPGSCPAESNYKEATAMVGHRLGMSDRNVIRYLKRAREVGLL